ncbi:hydroxymethylglutaryl-CoA lyase [Speluncibacter jeojiensis]|uniref:Hydroxymethylglutaryl-CoA lyase n=1 Tax=Speluncibacter jeojiensis TaxID=2710754 RepID=A0A9X4M1V9_9ACTN|nr:hydroxymethylglutaryl-CoA lyase [Corynebacteriales bacterium D3-21]
MIPTLPPAVSIREVGLRDGLQNERPVSTEAKLRLLDALAVTGVRRVELTAFVSPRAVPAMADAEALAAQAHRWPQLEFSALVAGPGGARRAVAAGIPDVEYVLSAAEGHSQANVRRGVDDSVRLTEQIAEIVHDGGGTCEVIIATAWDCPFDGPTPPERVVEIAGHAIALGADRISVADTVGTATPVRVVGLLDRLRAHLGDCSVGAHFHNTRGAGLACAYAAVQSGVVDLDASVGGLGGCPFAPGASGNIATEELVYLLEDCGVGTGIDLSAAIDAAAVARDVVGHELTSGLSRAGDRLRTAPAATGRR